LLYHIGTISQEAPFTIIIEITLLAAPRLRKFLRAVTQGSQSLALGLALVAAPQLISSMLSQDSCSTLGVLWSKN